MREVSQNQVLDFPVILLRGVGQVFFQNNPWTGFLIILGVAISSWVAAVDFLIGAAVATLVVRNAEGSATIRGPRAGGK